MFHVCSAQRRRRSASAVLKFGRTDVMNVGWSGPPVCLRAVAFNVRAASAGGRTNQPTNQPPPPPPPPVSSWRRQREQQLIPHAAPAEGKLTPRMHTKPESLWKYILSVLPAFLCSETKKNLHFIFSLFLCVWRPLEMIFALCVCSLLLFHPSWLVVAVCKQKAFVCFANIVCVGWVNVHVWVYVCVCVWRRTCSWM